MTGKAKVMDGASRLQTEEPMTKALGKNFRYQAISKSGLVVIKASEIDLCLGKNLSGSAHIQAQPS